MESIRRAPSRGWTVQEGISGNANAVVKDPLHSFRTPSAGQEPATIPLLASFPFPKLREGNPYLLQVDRPVLGQHVLARFLHHAR